MAPRARPCVLLAAAVLLAAVHSGNFLLPARWPRCSSSIPLRSRASRADEDNAQGSVWWMALNSSEALEAEDRWVELPVFPLSGAYFPFSEMELSIFEPRYRQLYNDILVSGGRRFVVVAPHPEEERVAEVGVVFYLDELTDVSEESGDEVKYICNHRIIERVRLRRILNPSAWKDASTYLRAEVEPFEDDDLLEDAKEQQEEVMALLTRLASRQEEMGGPHFESHISDYANASCAEQGGLWTLADVFAEYFEFLQSEKEQNLDIDIEQVYRKYNLEDQDDDNAGTAPFDEDVKDAPGGAPMSSYEPYEDDYEYKEVDLMELPSNARSELWRLQEQFEEEASVLNDDLMLFVHQMLQSRSHAERLKIMQRALLQEERRLAARKALQSVMLSIGSKEDE